MGAEYMGEKNIKRKKVKILEGQMIVVWDVDIKSYRKKLIKKNMIILMMVKDVEKNGKKVPDKNGKKLRVLAVRKRKELVKVQKEPQIREKIQKNLLVQNGKKLIRKDVEKIQKNLVVLNGN